MNKIILGFVAGVFLTGSLFQFNINLPSYNSNELKKLKEVKQIVNKRRAKLSSKSAKKVSKRAAAALIPVVGAVVITSLSIKEYCSDLEDNIRLSNLLNDTNEAYSYDECYANAEKDAKGVWEVMQTMVSNWLKSVDLEMPEMPEMPSWFSSEDS